MRTTAYLADRVLKTMIQGLNIGTCSWKYDSWRGVIYPHQQEINYLKEYSKHYRTVEIDQWFWSLFAGNKLVLPRETVVREYVDSTPDSFKFGIKVPNSITLSHHYKKGKADDLVANPYFLSLEVMHRFLDSIEEMTSKLALLMFQFDYLNKQKIPGGLDQFMDLFGEFSSKLPSGLSYCVEIRNPNYLNSRYFQFLNSNKLHHVFLQGYYMPSIFKLYTQFRQQIKDCTVIRLHGPDRKKIEKQTGNNWSEIVTPRDDELTALKTMLAELHSQKVEPFVFVNNHFEGSAPRTISRIEQLMSQT